MSGNKCLVPGALCLVRVEGSLPKAFGMTRAALMRAARHFAAKSAARIRTRFAEVTVILQRDAASAEAHAGIMGVQGPTDVITQRYDPMPGEAPGVHGELYVNTDQALRTGFRGAKELLLYIAHGMDHLSGADDHGETDYQRMRRRELEWIRSL